MDDNENGTKPDDTPTAVIFRKYSSGDFKGDVTALFPEIPSDYEGLYCTAYDHVGGHGGANYNLVISQTVPATEAEYAELKNKLESNPYYYKLNVYNRRTQAMRDAMSAALRAMK
jgi:hypothetical protein